MADYVPDYRMNEDDAIPSSSGFCNNEEEGLVEIFWSKGQVEERTLKKLKLPNSAVTSEARQQEQQQQPQLFIQEDEMASWLHLPLDDDDRFGGSDLVYPAPAPAVAVNYAAAASTSSQSNRGGRGAVTQIGDNRPPIPPRRLESGSNFSFFNPLRRLSGGRGEAVRESGVVEANRVGLGQRLESDGGGVNLVDGGGVNLVDGNAHLNAAEQETFTLDLTAVASSSGGVSSEKNDQKRKSRADEEEDHGEEGVDTKKRARGSSSARRSRAAEVHNLSERKRRDRINERMKALQELIPRSNKSDKASMLDDAIEYLKHLQLQVQVMSMGCSMVPMVFAGGQQYLVPMDMGLSRPIMPFPQVAGSSMPRPVAAAHLGPRHTIPAYLPPTGSDPLLSHYGVRGVNAMPVPFVDSYQHYFSQYNMQAPPYPPPETRTTAEASTSKDRSGENQNVKIRKLD